jgi:peptidoglycan/LPS O-acetylase OafA/YrhL
MTARSGKDEQHELRDPTTTTSSGMFLPELEGLRGLAILIVVLYHTSAVSNFVLMWTGHKATVPLALVRAGHTGVTLFFALSAFLLALPMLGRAGSRGRASVASFYRRRALRILPLYWTVLVVGACLAASQLSGVLRIVPYLAFLNGIWVFPQVSPYTEVTWSLATEVQFYLLLPLLPWVMVSRARTWTALLLAAAAYGALLAGVFVVTLGPAGWRFGSTIIGRGPIFACGIAAAWIYLRYGPALRTSWPVRAFGDVALVVCFVLLELLLRWNLRVGYLNAEFPPYVAWHAAEGVLWTLILLLVVTAPLKLRALLVNPVMLRLGVLSYSIYLLHWPLLLWSRGLLKQTFPQAGWNLMGAAWLVGTLVGIVLVSELTYRFIELPFLRRKSRVVPSEVEVPSAPAPALDTARSA